MSKKGIFEESKYLDPKYSSLDGYVLRAFKGFWTPARYERGMKEDAKVVNRKMSFIDRSFVKKNILCVAMIEDKVKSYWPTVGLKFPQTIISDVGCMFGMVETVHRRSYHSLNTEMGVDPSEANEHPVLRDRLDYLTKHSQDIKGITGRKKVLKDLILFTSLVEKGALFSYFYNLMSYANANKGLETIYALQKTTSCEEEEHFSFGIELINFVKKDYPELWDEELIELIKKDIDKAFQVELRIVDWLIEDGCPDHISREEMVNFVKHNFSTITKALNLDMEFDVDMDMYFDKSFWMEVAQNSREPDFFAKQVGDYSFEEEEVDIDEFNF